MKAWEKARIDGYSSFNKKDKFNPFNLTQPTSLLSRAIDKTGVDKKLLQKKLERNLHHFIITQKVSEKCQERLQLNMQKN